MKNCNFLFKLKFKIIFPPKLKTFFNQTSFLIKQPLKLFLFIANVPPTVEICYRFFALTLRHISEFNFHEARRRKVGERTREEGKKKNQLVIVQTQRNTKGFQLLLLVSNSSNSKANV